MFYLRHDFVAKMFSIHLSPSHCNRLSRGVIPRSSLSNQAFWKKHAQWRLFIIKLITVSNWMFCRSGNCKIGHHLNWISLNQLICLIIQSVSFWGQLRSYCQWWKELCTVNWSNIWHPNLSMLKRILHTELNWQPRSLFVNAEKGFAHWIEATTYIPIC